MLPSLLMSFLFTVAFPHINAATLAFIRLAVIWCGFPPFAYSLSVSFCVKCLSGDDPTESFFNFYLFIFETGPGLRLLDPNNPPSSAS